MQILLKMILYLVLSIVHLHAMVAFAQHQQTDHVLIGFTWGSKKGNDQAKESAKLDHQATVSNQDSSDDRSYRIGNRFWSGLLNAQDDADHRAGDGWYFSTHPFNSQRFGPDVLITEFRSKNGLLNSKIVKSMTPYELERINLQNYPTIVRYTGNWHVIKLIPQTHLYGQIGLDYSTKLVSQDSLDDLEIVVRKPTLNDAEIVFKLIDGESRLIKNLNIFSGIFGNDRLMDYYNRKGFHKKAHQSKKTRNYLFKLLELVEDSGFFVTAEDLKTNEKIDGLISRVGHLIHEYDQHYPKDYKNPLIRPEHFSKILEDLTESLRQQGRFDLIERLEPYKNSFYGSNRCHLLF